MAFADHWSYLLGQVQELSSLQAPLLVNQAWSDIRSAKDDWSFLVKETVVTVPDAVSAGTVTVTQDSATVTTSAAAKTALDAVGATALVGRVFRAGGSSGPIYLIQTYDPGTGNITLDRVYFEATTSATTYQVTGPYITPAADFERWIVMRDPVNGFRIRLNFTRAELDRMDQQRGATGDPLILGAKDYNSTGIPRYEFWPHPVVRRAYQALYGSAGTDLSATVDIPSIIPAGLLRERSLYRAYEWAEANQGRFQGLRGTDWRFLMREAERRFKEQLKETMLTDDSVFNAQWGENYLDSPMGGIIDGKYLQQHAPWGPS